MAINFNIGGVNFGIPGLPGISLGVGNASGPTNAGATNQFSIENFRQNINKHNETVRSDKFDVYIVPPPAVCSYAGVTGMDAARGFSLQCEVSELPGRDIQMIEYRLHQFVERIPHTNQFGQATFTFIVTGDMWEKKLFDAWLDYMAPAQTGLINYALDGSLNRNYECDINCNQYDNMGNLTYTAALKDCMPTSVSPLNQSWDNDAIHKLTVTFQFRKWLGNNTTFNQTTTFTGINPSILPNATSGIISTDPTASNPTPGDQRVPTPGFS